MTHWIDPSAALHWLWHATWEASLLSLVIIGIQALLRKKLAPQWSFALWWLVIARLLIPATLPAPWSAFNLFSSRADRFSNLIVPEGSAPEPQFVVPVPASMPVTIPEPGYVGASARPEASGSRRGWLYPAMGCVWLLGAVALGIRLWFANARLTRLLRDGTEIRDEQMIELLKDCARLMGVRRCPALLLTQKLDSPALAGCFRPRLLLPQSLESALSASELRHVFLHELAHIRRRDLVLNWLLCCLQVVHWFNPILRYAFRRMEGDRELACDAVALSRMQPAETHCYGQTILKILERLTRPTTVPGLVGLLEEKQQVKRRIEMIAHTPSSKNPALAAALLAALGMFTLTDAQTAGPATATADSAPVEVGQVQSAQPAASPELMTQERQIDKQHLERIYKAIRAYYKDHKDLPNWLSDLVPQYLQDPNDLVSPIEKRTGKSVLFGREDPRIHTSYIYEFNAAPAPEEFNKGRAVPLTCKEWKLMQLQKFGMITPILRSHIDQPVLNVAYSGLIYETGLLWENDPSTAAAVRQHPRLGPQQGQPPGPGLTVHVVDATNGAAIASATVRNGIGSEFGLLPPGQGDTDASGNMSVPLGEWKINFLFLTANAPGYYPLGTEWNRETAQQDSPPAEMTLRLIPKPTN